jgi:hypothetical protein
MKMAIWARGHISCHEKPKLNDNIHLLQRNPGSKKGMQLIKWGTCFSRIPKYKMINKLLLDVQVFSR